MNKTTVATPLVALVATVAVVAMAFMGAATRGASAKTYAHGKTIFFGTHTIDEGDVVNGDLNIVMADVTCDDGAVIRGDVRSYGGHFTQLDGCEVDGEVMFAPNGSAAMLPWLDADAGNRAIIDQNRHTLRHLAWAVVVFFAFLLFPLRVRVALERVERHPGLSAAVGTLAAVAVIPVAILLLLSVIGIPLIVVEVAAVLAGLWIGHAAVAILIGRRLYELLRPHVTPTPLGALALGLLVIVAAEMLPMFGWVVMLLVSLVGLGATILGFVRETAFASTASAPPVGGAPMRTT